MGVGSKEKMRDVVVMFSGLFVGWSYVVGIEGLAEGWYDRFPPFLVVYYTISCKGNPWKVFGEYKCMQFPTECLQDQTFDIIIGWWLGCGADAEISDLNLINHPVVAYIKLGILYWTNPWIFVFYPPYYCQLC